MVDKLDDEFFDRLSKQTFDKFFEAYISCFDEFGLMMTKVQKCIEFGEDPSKSHLAKMRNMTINLEKLGKKFRTKTIEMEKKK